VEKGDILLQAAGQPVQTKAQLDSLTGSRKPGDKLKLQISRFNKKREVSVLLTANPVLATSLEEKYSKKVVRQRKNWLSSKAAN
jgi:S1-C subfamily serine protease